jgi:ADP-ribose pyrophosphatase
LGFEVAVSPHFLASFNKEFHYNALRYQFPNNDIDVLNDLDEIAEYLQQDLSILSDYNLTAVSILPEELCDELNDNQRKIIESICMHWTEVHLTPLGGGFSGSALFLANGKQGLSKTEPMVIKIDSHYPIQMEINGYNQVKDFLGKHVPSFTFPVNEGNNMGIAMELAAMEGPPSTLQDHYEDIQDDYSLDSFLKLLDRMLTMLMNRLYKNTSIKKPLAPFRHFELHISRQNQRLVRNLKNLQRHQVDAVMINPDMIIKLFDVIRKNSDALYSEMCIAHGDLNMANVIVDDHGNLWTIDWTYTGQHPLSMDFCKLENDIKYVATKEIELRDLPKLQLFEEVLLNNLIPPPLDKLPKNLLFVKWDLRFKKVYLTIQKLRQAYSKHINGDNWLVYKINLLRYSLHTLSWDKSIGRGECEPVQLLYAYLTTETLLFQLMADDYHLKIRSERPSHYPERFRIPLDLSNWDVLCEDYSPPYFVDEMVISQDSTKNPNGKADPENQWDFKSFIDWGRAFTRDKHNKPLNPSGRTGIEGRGSLWLWGPNPRIFMVPLRYNRQTEQIEVFLQLQDDSQELLDVHLRRNESLDAALSRARDKLPLSVKEYEIIGIHEGYLYDSRQTDNAWIEAKAFLLFKEMNDSDDGYSLESKFNWKILESSLINGLHSSYATLLREALEHILKEKLAAEAPVKKLLDKTG